MADPACKTIDPFDLPALRKLAQALAKQLQVGDLVTLKGDLGAGKTTLARHIIAALGHEGEVPSPTYTILETYPAPPLAVPVVHADLYRLDGPGELAEIGLEDYRREAALLVEWPDRMEVRATDPSLLQVEICMVGNERQAIVKRGPGWQGRT
jgi:tRNA threonylcarbamoyladenosine biosynthesis protein TsaE